jgi:16S rRNA G1207 methylase RsmC
MQEHYFSDHNSEEIQLADLAVEILGNTHQLKTAQGLFSAKAIDKGTTVLLHYLSSSRGLELLESSIEQCLAKTDQQQVKVLDIGCGWGTITLFIGLLLRTMNAEAQIDSVDVNSHAVQVTKLNADSLNLKVNAVQGANPSEAGLSSEKYDIILSNPPIRIGKSNTVQLLDAYLNHLNEGGIALFLIQKNLGSDSIAADLTDLGYNVQKLSSSKGFRILQVSKGVSK